MTNIRKVFTKEFKQKAVELSNVRGNTQEVARELGIGAELIYRWRKEIRHNPDLAFGGNGKAQLTPEQKEVARLKRELADVKMERDILKKAVSISACGLAGSPRAIGNLPIHEGLQKGISNWEDV